MSMRATIHLPPDPGSGYVRVELDGKTVGFLKQGYYDVVCHSVGEFKATMVRPGAEEEAHSIEGRWVVRLREAEALAALHGHLAGRTQ